MPLRTFKGQDRRIGAIIKTLLGQFTTQKELDEFLEWQDKNGKYLSESKLAVSQAVENARVNIDWANKNQKLVVEKLREFSVSHHLEQPSWASWRKKPLFMSSLYAIHNISSSIMNKPHV
ncbi:jg9762 [Pararge aegeria aegeria]|uniref:Jg9762 protein n=1 Tax=Pararge aegeria aegeria TaxID=348720 RepID=A0A8S4S917_9NEOP|nr:jg9762 [Pararge aegeria aegeria]